MRDYDEKRDFRRVPVGCPAQFRIAGSTATEQAQMRDLSATGMLFSAQRPIAPGTRMAVVVPSGTETIPPLVADVTVLRCEADEGGYSIALSIERMLRDDDDSA